MYSSDKVYYRRESCDYCVCNLSGMDRDVCVGKMIRIWSFLHILWRCWVLVCKYLNSSLKSKRTYDFFNQNTIKIYFFKVLSTHKLLWTKIKIHNGSKVNLHKVYLIYFLGSKGWKRLFIFFSLIPWCFGKICLVNKM